MSMQSKSKSANQGEASFYNVENSSSCFGPWWKNTGYNSFSHPMMKGDASETSSLEHSVDGLSQSEGAMNEEDDETIKQTSSTVSGLTGRDGNPRMEDTNLQQAGSTTQPRPNGNLAQTAQFELAAPSIACASNPYDPYCGGMTAAAYGQPMIPHLYDPTHHLRMPLPLEMAQEPVYVNAKQYKGILRRRQSRAKAELEKKLIKSRKPYLHESRHQHAMRRARSSGGRFAKKSDNNASSKKTVASPQSINPSTSCGSEAPDAQHLYNSGNFQNQPDLQEHGYQSRSGNMGDGHSSGQQWGSVSSNHPLAMQ
ncbi:nuclear transcription factor Y subunit A-1-like [Andrographis paniculata]|uniref:nuclear transcription factor Y subunit A-1-like n=1 Tax=Andrographis paniculata TaxID=175694 RepID=UPI0021E84815|nr:nuclear transcription factor Y subunit A-1-like [Andrographis paniculata]XP_051143636.1 nuclear transcription factor Y subunit A-1-like [Andrographis paniculata]XP_051143637.1 nuclear transcription factor Y subunit A-1-like [Andrographis paniculata]